MCNSVWLGADVSKAWVDVAVAGPEARVQDVMSLPHTRVGMDAAGMAVLGAWLCARGIEGAMVSGVCAESTGRYSERFAALAGPVVGPVSIVNPKRVLDYGRSLGVRDKSDWRDACVLALFGKERRPGAGVCEGRRRALRDLVRAHVQLQRNLATFRQRVEEAADAVLRRTFRELARAIETRVKRLERRMDALIGEDDRMREDCRLGMTIPGVSKAIMRVVLAEVGDVRRFSRKELVAYAGLYPVEYASGSSVRRRARMAKGGGGLLRAVLYMGAMSARRHNPHMKAFADRLIAQGKKPMCALGATMRKLLLLIRSVVVSGRAYDSNYPASVESTTA